MNDAANAWHDHASMVAEIAAARAGDRQVPRFDHPLRLDNALFAVAMVVAAAFAAERFYAQEDEKAAIAQARELRNSAVARAEESCLETEPAPTRQSDIQEPCINPPVRRK
jgi:hypothetical protein